MIGNNAYSCKEDTYELIARAQRGEEDAKEDLNHQNTGLVKSIALKFIGAGYELDDLLQLGYIGLLKAVERFDTSYGVMFSTYAVPMILGEIKRYLRDDGRIKVGRQIKLDIKRMKKIQEEFCQKTSRYPKVSELAEEMEMDTEQILSLMEARDAMTSLESLDDPERCQQEYSDDFRDVEEKQVNMIQLKGIICHLAEQERQVVVLRYFKDMTQQQIATKLGISQVQVSRIEKRVLAFLRKEMQF